MRYVIDSKAARILNEAVKYISEQKRHHGPLGVIRKSISFAAQTATSSIRPGQIKEVAINEGPPTSHKYGGLYVDPVSISDALSVLGTGDGTAYTVQVTAGAVILVKTGGTGPGTSTLLFSVYTTLTTMVAAINALAGGYAASVLGVGAADSSNLFVISATNCKAVAVTLEYFSEVWGGYSLDPLLSTVSTNGLRVQTSQDGNVVYISMSVDQYCGVILAWDKLTNSIIEAGILGGESLKVIVCSCT